MLQRTKSLENILGSSPEKTPNPLMSRKHTVLGKPMGKPPQVGTSSVQAPRTCSPPQFNGYDHIDGFASHSPSIANPTGPGSPIFSKKPEPARKVAGKNPYKKVMVDPQLTPQSERSPPTSSIPSPPHRAPEPLKSNFLPKTYVAVEDYTSQAPGCLTFKAGDRCVLMKNSAGGWWFVNIGGREGWTPGEFWQEDHRVRVSSVLCVICPYLLTSSLACRC